MGRWRPRRGGADDDQDDQDDHDDQVPENEDDLDTIFEKISQSVDDSPALAFWCRRALRLRRVQAEPYLRALVLRLLARGLRDLPDGDRRADLELALEAATESMSLFRQLGDNENLASAAHDLGMTWNERIAGDRKQNIEQSIEFHTQALAFARDPGTRGMAAYSLAQRYRARLEGDFSDNIEAAIENAKTAIECYKASRETTRLADAFSLLGLCYGDRRTGDVGENMQEAIACHKAAMQACPEGSRSWIRAGTELGKACDRMAGGEEASYREFAIDVFERVLRATDPRAHPAEWSSANHALGIVYQARILGDRSENIELAIKYLTASLEYARPEDDLENWQLTHQSLAACYDYRLAGDRGQNLDRALGHLTTALDAVDSPDYNPNLWAMLHQSVALVHLNRATNGSPRGNREQDVRLARQAIERVLSVRTRETDPVGFARAQQTLVAIHEKEAEFSSETPRDDRGGNQESRIQAIKTDIDMLRSTCETDSRDADPAIWANNRLVLAKKLGDLAGATDPNAYLDERINLLRETLEVHTANSKPGLCALAAKELGTAYASSERWKEAADAFCLAVNASDAERATAFTVLGRRYHEQSGESVPPLAAYCLAKAGRLMDAVGMLERGRARSLGDALDREHTRLDDLASEHPQLHRQYHDAAVRLRRLQDAEHPSGDAGEVLTELASRIRTAQQALDMAVRRVRHAPGYEDFLAEPGPSRLDEAVLADVPIAYLTTTPWGSVSFLLSRGDAVKVTALWAPFADTEMNDLLHRSVSENTIFPFMSGYLRVLYNIVESRFSDGNSALMFGRGLTDPGAVHRGCQEELGKLGILGEQLVRPLVTALAELRPSRVVLIPCGLLALAPLHTIAYDGERCLIDDMAVSYAPSARVVRHARHRADELARSERAVLAGVGNPMPHQQPLWFATRELSEISVLFEEATCLYGEEATKDRVLDVARTATHVHLACHGAVPFAGDQAPYLELAGGERLTLDEIARSRPFPAARIVVLSACQSALVGSFQRADEAIGLPTAVMLSGTPGVVGSLWAVNDLATSLLMKRFYDLLLASGGNGSTGVTASRPWDALRHAQRWLSELTAADVSSFAAADPALRHLAEEYRTRSSGADAVLAAIGEPGDPGSRPFADPYYWAPFVYIGE